MKISEQLLVALEDTSSYLRDMNLLWRRSSQLDMAADLHLPAEYSGSSATAKLFGSRYNGSDLRSVDESVFAAANQWESGLFETYSSVKNEDSEPMVAPGYLNMSSNAAASPFDENMFAAELTMDAFVKQETGVGASQLGYNTNDAMSAGYFRVHAVAASFSDPSTGEAIPETWDRPAIPSELALFHRHSMPNVGSARTSSPDRDFIEQLNNGLYDLSRLYTSSALAPTTAAPITPSLPNYILDQPRSVSEELDNSIGHGIHSSWRTTIDRDPDCDSAHDSCLDSDRYDTIPMACISAQERWNLFIKNKAVIPEPQESMVCTHCEASFDQLDKYLEHLDTEKVKHENFCPDSTCAFSAIGFRFRWFLRRHICNHHLKAYNNDSVKKHSLKVPEKLLKEFLRHVYVCNEPKCSRAFYRLDSLLRHMRLIHGLQKKTKPFRKERSGK